jgi:hypothetical protein
VVSSCSALQSPCAIILPFTGDRRQLADLSFIKEHAAAIIKTTPVDYLKHAKLTGSLFEGVCDSKVVSSVYTEFFVDHTEPLEALENFKQCGGVWPLGELLEGHEFFMVVKARSQDDV